tara:strand:- start:1751 stop:2014 length:264 start_codon:yes stop_codon:yes gene_type:complete
MNIFLVVSFIMANTMSIDRPLYIFQSPSFGSVAECKDYVSVMYQRIYNTAAASYNFELTPEAIYCVKKEQLRDLFKYNYEQQNKENI